MFIFALTGRTIFQGRMDMLDAASSEGRRVERVIRAKMLAADAPKQRERFGRAEAAKLDDARRRRRVATVGAAAANAA